MNRVRLVYADGTDRVEHILAEPEDPASYSRWFVKRLLQSQLGGPRREAGRRGLANQFAHRYPKSKNGAALKHVDLHKVKYRLPKPGSNVRRSLHRQFNRELNRPYWRYDPKRKRGKHLRRTKGR